MTFASWKIEMELNNKYKAIPGWPAEIFQPNQERMKGNIWGINSLTFHPLLKQI